MCKELLVLRSANQVWFSNIEQNSDIKKVWPFVQNFERRCRGFCRKKQNFYIASKYLLFKRVA